MNVVARQVRELVDVELAAANERFPQFHSAHEGYAVILEEVEELEEPIENIKLHMNCIFADIRANRSSRGLIDCVLNQAVHAACEAIQVAAMCQKFLDMENDTYDGEG